MQKKERYQDYVIVDGELIGEFEQMYQRFDDPWEQSTRETFASEKAALKSVVKSLGIKSAIEIGCGLGFFTRELKKDIPDITGIDISETAIEKAKKLHKGAGCKFIASDIDNFDLFRTIKPQCILMPEVTWYVLNELDNFLNFLREELPDVVIAHSLMTYEAGQQQYGRDKFTSHNEIMDYFDMDYLESGEIKRKGMPGARTFFVGKFKSR